MYELIYRQKMSVVIDMYIIYIYIYLCFIFYKKKNWFDVLIPKFRSGEMCIFFTSKDSKSIVKTP